MWLQLSVISFNAVVNVSVVAVVSVSIDHPLEYDSYCRTKHTTAPLCRWADESFNISPHIDLISLTCLNLFYLLID